MSNETINSFEFMEQTLTTMLSLAKQQRDNPAYNHLHIADLHNPLRLGCGRQVGHTTSMIKVVVNEDLPALWITPSKTSADHTRNIVTEQGATALIRVVEASQLPKFRGDRWIPMVGLLVLDPGPYMEIPLEGGEWLQVITRNPIVISLG